MNTIQLQLNKKVAAFSAEHPYEYAALRSMMLISGILILVYLYLVSASVLNIIAQKEAGRMSASLESNLGELEGRFFALSDELTSDHASRLGLHPLEESSFVYRLTNVSAAPAAHNAI